MGEFDPLALAGENDIVIADDRTAADAGQPDRALGPRTRQPCTAVDAQFGQRRPPPARRGLAKQDRGAGRSIDLVAVMRFDDLDIPVGAEARRCLAHQLREQRDTKRGIARLEDRDVSRRGIDHGVLVDAEARGADDDRRARRPGGGDMRLQGGGGGEVDQNVGYFRERERIAAGIDAAGLPRPRSLDLLGDRAAHPTAAAVDADRGHSAPDRS